MYSDDSLRVEYKKLLVGLQSVGKGNKTYTTVKTCLSEFDGNMSDSVKQKLPKHRTLQFIA